MKSLKLGSKSKSSPRFVVATNETVCINNCCIIGDGIEISVGKEMKNALQMLLMAYYVFDLSYPKYYQVLGFLHVIEFEDDAPFYKGSNYLKFKKMYDDFKMKVPVGNKDDVQEEN